MSEILTETNGHFAYLETTFGVGRFGFPKHFGWQLGTFARTVDEFEASQAGLFWSQTIRTREHLVRNMVLVGREYLLKRHGVEHFMPSREQMVLALLEKNVLPCSAIAEAVDKQRAKWKAGEDVISMNFMPDPFPAKPYVFMPGWGAYFAARRRQLDDVRRHDEELAHVMDCVLWPYAEVIGVLMTQRSTEGKN